MRLRKRQTAHPTPAGRDDRARLRLRFRPLLVVAAILTGSVGVASAPVPAGAQTAPTGPTSYVALGDSFTAGPLIPRQLTDPVGCLRSDRNYPHLVATHSGQDELRDVSCSGASTRHMFREHNVLGGPNPPQLDALDADTGLVTLGISGNDIGFSDIIETCATVWPFGSPCRNHYTAGGQDEITRRITEAGPRVSEVLDAIAERAPGARVLVIGYPALVPHQGSNCWPTLPLAWNDVPYLREKQEELNAMLIDRATAHGVEYIDVYGPSAGRDACASSLVRWVEPLIPANAAAPVHPNARGMAGMADQIIAAL